jgi:hypothetical protein
MMFLRLDLGLNLDLGLDLNLNALPVQYQERVP